MGLGDSYVEMILEPVDHAIHGLKCLFHNYQKGQWFTQSSVLLMQKAQIDVNFIGIHVTVSGIIVILLTFS